MVIAAIYCLRAKSTSGPAQYVEQDLGNRSVFSPVNRHDESMSLGRTDSPVDAVVAEPEREGAALYESSKLFRPRRRHVEYYPLKSLNLSKPGTPLQHPKTVMKQDLRSTRAADTNEATNAWVCSQYPARKRTAFRRLFLLRGRRAASHAISDHG